MTRNLKALGLAFAAMLCMGAVAASAASAQAQGELTADGPVTLIADETAPKTVEGNLPNAFTSPVIGDITCTGSILTGHKYNETPHELLDGEGGETTATVTPHYTGCEAHTFFTLITVPAAVNMNGCDYVLHVGETTGEGETYGVTADLVCPAEKDVEITIYGNEEETEEICQVTIEEQTGLSGPHLTNNGDHVDLDGEFGEIKESHEGSGCGEGETEAAVLDVDYTVTGEKEGGGATPISISDTE